MPKKKEKKLESCLGEAFPLNREKGIEKESPKYTHLHTLAHVMMVLSSLILKNSL